MTVCFFLNLDFKNNALNFCQLIYPHSPFLFLRSSAPSDLWKSTGEEVASALRALGLPIGPVVTMKTRKMGGPQEALQVIREAEKVKGQSRLVKLSKTK